MSIILTFLVIAVIILVRNELVCKAQTHAIDIIYSRDDWEDLRIKYLQNYFGLVFDVSKWTFDQLFPGLKGKI